MEANRLDLLDRISAQAPIRTRVGRDQNRSTPGPGLPHEKSLAAACFSTSRVGYAWFQRTWGGFGDVL
jgi:hypothetical protein